MLSARVKLRPICDEDQDFLSALYASTRTEEMALIPWSEVEKHTFLQMQFETQHRYYQQHYVNACFDLVYLDDKAIGRFYVQRQEDEIRIIDIALLSAYRGQGIGRFLLENVLAEARQASIKVRIHVESSNPALSLYQSLGFQQVKNKDIYILMEYCP